MRPRLRFLAFVCLLLTFWSAWALIAHQHSSAADAVKCAVCVAAHSTVPKSIAVVQKATFLEVALLRPQGVTAQQVLLAFALSVRPPPEI
jgi:hypothetical protein